VSNAQNRNEIGALDFGGCIGHGQDDYRKCLWANATPDPDFR
jgi:hypothetical protein